MNPFKLANVHIALGPLDEAFGMLYQPRNKGSHDIRWLTWEHLFDPIRSDPRFIALMEELNLTVIEYD
jgi:hypothetical protein